VSAIGQVQVDERDGVVVARLTGEFDLSNVGDVEQTIARSVGHETRGVVVDLTGTTYLDSTGIRMIFGLKRRLDDRRQQLHLVSSDAALVSRVLSLTRLPEAVPVHVDVEAAVDALRQSA
jgi:anti-anti-sigma factor